MAAIKIAGAPKDMDRMGQVARLLGAEGFDVEIARRQVDTEDLTPATLCTIVLWSRNSVDAWPVLATARAALARKSLVQIALEPVRPDIDTPHTPIDFRGWNGERGGAWRLLRERIDQIQRGEEPAGAPLLAMTSLGFASFSILALAVSDRVGVGPAPEAANHVADPFVIAATSTGGGEGGGAMGGPSMLEPELIIEGGDFTPPRLRAPAPLRFTQLRELPDISAPRRFARVDLSRPGILRRIINVAEDNIPFIGEAPDARSASTQ